MKNKYIRESRFKIGPVVLEFSQNKQTDKNFEFLLQVGTYIGTVFTFICI